jgi:hypothetical protein
LRRRQTTASIILPIGLASGALGQEDLPAQHSLLPQQNVRVMGTRSVGIERDAGTRRGGRSMVVDRLRCIGSLKARHGCRGLLLFCAPTTVLWFVCRPKFGHYCLVDDTLFRRRHTPCSWHPRTGRCCRTLSQPRPSRVRCLYRSTPPCSQQFWFAVKNLFIVCSTASTLYQPLWLDASHVTSKHVWSFLHSRIRRAQQGKPELTKIVASALSLETVLEILYPRE